LQVAGTGEEAGKSGKRWRNAGEIARARRSSDEDFRAAARPAEPFVACPEPECPLFGQAVAIFGRHFGLDEEGALRHHFPQSIGNRLGLGLGGGRHRLDCSAKTHFSVLRRFDQAVSGQRPRPDVVSSSYCVGQTFFTSWSGIVNRSRMRESAPCWRRRVRIQIASGPYARF